LSAGRIIYPLCLFAAAVLPLLVVRALGSPGDSG
jgi:hypothetical protein